MRRALVLTALFLLGACTLGCGGKATEPVKVSIEGKITHGGKGVGWVLVTFNGATPDVRYETNTEKDGAFTLQCPPGTYKVTLTAVPLGQGQAPGGGAGDGALANLPDAKGLKEIPHSYRSPGTTPWKNVEIPETGKRDLTLEVN
jgi:hypothetical protein